MINDSGKFFSVICDRDYQVYIYNIEKCSTGKLGLDKLETADEIVGTTKYKRIFYLNNPLPEGNDLLVVTIKGKRISVSRYILDNNLLKVQKNVANVSYEVLSTDDDSEIEFQYVEDMKKAICVFDVNNKSELVPACYYNNKEEQIKGRFKLGANKKYVILKLGKKENEKTA